MFAELNTILDWIPGDYPNPGDAPFVDLLLRSGDCLVAFASSSILSRLNNSRIILTWGLSKPLEASGFAVEKLG